MNNAEDVSIAFDRQAGEVVIRQDDDLIVILPCEIQAVITGLMQAYADSVDETECRNGG